MLLGQHLPFPAWRASGLAARQHGESMASRMAAYLPLPIQLIQLSAKMERELLSSVQRLPGLPSSLVGLETLLDKDDEIDFEDVFNLEENAPNSRMMGPNFGLHDVMERRLNMKF
mmetsp:Transcript_6739/g.9293  ORF Transcript_6739/g.9293 Transcript_6739/m.9293 type:complete len:115 (+) Transcript_6739:371-715(+)